MQKHSWPLIVGALALSTTTSVSSGGCGSRAGLAGGGDGAGTPDGGDASGGPAGAFAATDLSVTPAGKLVVLGTLTGTIVLDGTSMTSAGGDDVVLATFDPAGHLVWAKRFGDADNQEGGHLAVDADGSIAMIVSFGGQLDLGGGALVSSGGADLCLGKLDAAGTHIWSRRFGGPGLESEEGIAFDSAGRILAAASSTLSFDFGGTPPSTASSHNTSVVQLSGAGSVLWSRAWGGADARALSVSPSDSVVLVGSSFEAVDFGGGLLANKGIGDVFVVELTSSGGHVFSHRYGGSGSAAAVASDVSTDASGDVLLTGTFSGGLDIGSPPLMGVPAQDHANNPTDLFVAKLDAAGNALWSRKSGSASQNQSGVGVGLAADSSGNVAITGTFDGSIDFGLGALSAEHAGYPSGFVLETDPSGVSSWNQRVPYGVTRVRTTAAGHVLLAGGFATLASTADFGAALRTLSTTGNAFLAEYVP